MTNLIKPVRTYECWIPGWEETEQQRSRFVRQNAKQAKYAYLKLLRDCDYFVRYIDVRCRSLRKIVENPNVTRIAQYRDVPFVTTGMPCKVYDNLGRIVDAGGGGAYLQVQYSQSGTLEWFHPQGDRVVWLNEDGTEFNPEKGAA